MQAVASELGVVLTGQANDNWGSLGGVGSKDTTVNWSWSRADRDRVLYSALQLGRGRT